MPPVELAGHLRDCWHEAGLHGYGASGPVPLNDLDLRAFCANACTNLLPREIKSVKDMSHAYLAERQAAEDPLRRVPFGDSADHFDRTLLARRLRTTLSAAANASARTQKGRK